MNALRVFLTTAIVAALGGPTSDTRAQGMQASLPAYQPAQKVAGVIRTWGHGSRDKDYIGCLVSSWERGFQKYQTEVDFEARLRGDKSAIGGLYTGAADVALMERDLSAIEKDSYEQLFGRTDPFEVSVATGSLDVRNHGMALVIFVHKDNPLAQLTLAQLDAIFGADHRRGLNNIRTWGELGLTGEWVAKPIHTYGFGIEQDPSQYFQTAVMGGSQKWTGNLKEFDDLRSADGTVAEAGRRIVNAVSHDRQGIAISQMAYQNSQVKPLALASEEGGPYYKPSRETLAQRQYPLARKVKLYVNGAPGGQPIDPKVKEYLRYILSREGQEDIARDGGYLPLSPELAAQERRKLE